MARHCVCIHLGRLLLFVLLFLLLCETVFHCVIGLVIRHVNLCVILRARVRLFVLVYVGLCSCVSVRVCVFGRVFNCVRRFIWVALSLFLRLASIGCLSSVDVQVDYACCSVCAFVLLYD